MARPPHRATGNAAPATSARLGGCRRNEAGLRHGSGFSGARPRHATAGHARAAAAQELESAPLPARVVRTRALGKAQLEVAQRNVATSAPSVQSTGPSPRPSGASSAQRQPVQQPQQSEHSMPVNAAASQRVSQGPLRAARHGFHVPSPRNGRRVRLAVAVVAPQVLLRALQDQPLHRAVDHRGSGTLIIRQRLAEFADPHQVAGAFRQALAPHQQQRRTGLLHQPRPASSCTPACRRTGPRRPDPLGGT
jgi:hypothetical protein